MNTIDWLVALVAVAALWTGWQRGFILQICSLAGIVIAIWVASRYGAAVGGWMHLDPEVATAGGFLTLLLFIVLAVAVTARLVRGLFRFAGFGILDRLGGVAVALVKYLLVLSALFKAFNTLNYDYALVGQPVIAGSKCYRPVMELTDRMLPLLEWVGDRIPAAEAGDDSPQPSGQAV